MYSVLDHSSSKIEQSDELCWKIARDMKADQVGIPSDAVPINDTRSLYLRFTLIACEIDITVNSAELKFAKKINNKNEES